MTASAIISIISAVLSIAKFLVEYAQQQKWIDKGAAEASLKGLQDSDEAITMAQKARETVRAAIAAKPDSVREDDGFRRSDDS